MQVKNLKVFNFIIISSIKYFLFLLNYLNFMSFEWICEHLSVNLKTQIFYRNLIPNIYFNISWATLIIKQQPHIIVIFCFNNLSQVFLSLVRFMTQTNLNLNWNSMEQFKLTLMMEEFKLTLMMEQFILVLMMEQF